MATTIFTVPAGQTSIIPAPALSSICVQPAATGSGLLSFGTDGISPIFTAAPQGANTSPYSFNTSTWSGIVFGQTQAPMGNIGKISVAATTVACTVLVSDLSQYPGSFPERQTVLQSGVAYTMPNSTSELPLVSIRFHAGYFKPNFRLEWHAQFTAQNTANAKTIKSYFGASTNSATAGAIETSAASSVSQVLTSLAGGYLTGSFFGRNDGATVIASNTGLAAAGGVGMSATANVSTTTAYQTTEQVFTLTGTKATGAETVTLDAILVKVYQ
jgi:hypothetical protein